MKILERDFEQNILSSKTPSHQLVDVFTKFPSWVIKLKSESGMGHSFVSFFFSM